MDYDDHETNPNMIELSRKQRTGPKVALLPEWDQVSVPSEVSSEETPDEDHTTLEENEPLILKESVMAYSIKHARMLALDALGKVDVAPSDARVFEYYVDLITPLGSQSIADQIQKMREAVDLTQLVDLFNEAAEELPPRVWYQLHDRMTETLNRRLRGGLSFQADIDSITDDYDDLMDLLAKDYSNTAVDRFKRNVKAHILRP